MDKNESFDIKPVMNGFSVNHNYRDIQPTKNNPRNWEYSSDEYFFKTWEEVVSFITSNPLTFPPTKI